MNAHRILCLWFPQWPIQRRWVADATLRQRPLILKRRDPRRGDVVAYGSWMARQRGIRVGMPVVEATALLSARFSPSDSTFTVLAHVPTDDRANLERLATWCQQFSPRVGLEESPDPSALLLDITGSAPRLGGEEQLVCQLVTECRRQGYVVFAAVAPTVGAAWAISHTLQASPDAHGDFYPDPSVSRPGQQQRSEGDGWRVIGPGDLRRALGPLPLAALRIDQGWIETFQMLGVTTIDPLLQLPRAGLRRRFGDSLLRRIDQAFGTIAEPVVAYVPPPSLEVRYVLEHPTQRISMLEPILRQLAEQLANRLLQRNTGAVQLECDCHLQDRSTVGLSIGLYQPTACADLFHRLFRLRLESLRLAAPLVEVHLRATVTAELEYSHEMLWGETRYDERSLGQLIDKLANRLGPDAVVGARWLADPQPEQSFRLIALSGSKPAPPASTTTTRDRHDSTLRPLSLYSPAHPLTQVRTTSDGRLASFQHERSHHQVRACWGPERIQTGWWRGTMIHRDYYRIEDHHGCRHWIYRELRSGHWFLHGSFW